MRPPPYRSCRRIDIIIKDCDEGVNNVSISDEAFEDRIDCRKRVQRTRKMSTLGPGM